MSALLAVDAGGTHTRAICIDEDGGLRGLGRSSSGNPTSVGQQAADAAVVAAMRSALADAGIGPSGVSGVLCAAGEPRARRLAGIAAEVGLDGAERLSIASDSVAAFLAVADEPTGFAVVVGTGAAAVRVHHSAQTSVVDGEGWLLGDSGSGYWIGHQVVRAVAADRGGRGPMTALSERVFSVVSPDPDARWGAHRQPEIAALMSWAYDRPPTALAVFAPFAFELEAADDVARAIVLEAESGVAATISRVRGGERHLPLAGTGSVLLSGFLAAGRPAGPLAEELTDADLRLCADGIVGAGMLALRRAGHAFDPETRRRLAGAMRARSGGEPADARR